MKAYSSLYSLLLVVLLSACQQPLIDSAIDLHQNIQKSNKMVDQQIKELLKEIETYSVLDMRLRQVEDFAKTLVSQMRQDDQISSYRQRLCASSGIYLYEGHLEGRQAIDRKAAYQAQGFSSFRTTTNPQLEAWPVDAQSSKLVDQIFIEEAALDSLEQLLVHTYTELTVALTDFIQKSEHQSITNFQPQAEAFQTLQTKLSQLLLLNDDGKAATPWQAMKFTKTQVAEVYPLLSSIEGLRASALFYVLDFLKASCLPKRIQLDDYVIFSTASSAKVKLGESFKTEIRLGAFASNVDFSVEVDGKALPMQGNKVLYEIGTKQLGTQSYTAHFQVLNNLTGEVERIQKEFKYEVVAPNN